MICSDPETLARRNGVEAAGMPGAALHEAARGEGQTQQQAAFAQRLAGIMRAGGGKTAAAGRRENNERRRHGPLVNPDQAAQGTGGERNQKARDDSS